jgi:hypothetical protein
MVRPSNPIAALLLASLGVACTTATGAGAALPGWMAGSWCANAHGRRIEEVWLAPAGGLMLGMSRTIAPNQKGPQFEFLRIELRDGVPAYVAQPQGAAAVAFALSEASGSSARFENKAHDFPQRIEYRRAGHTLRAEIAGPGPGGKERVIGFDYEPCAGEPKR